MEMQKDAMQYLVSLAKPETYEIGGQSYTSQPLTRIPNYIPTLERIAVTSLASIVKLVKAEVCKVGDALPLFIRVVSPRMVSVFSTYGQEYKRHYLYDATCDVPDFYEGFRPHDKAIIELRSRFFPSEGSDYLLDLLSRISKESVVSSEDNGVSQTVEARKGISLKEKVQIRSRVLLRPYRTFLEVEQPESEFILRLNDNGDVGLFEADGGAWQLEAKKNVMEYFESALSDLVSSGSVVVME